MATARRKDDENLRIASPPFVRFVRGPSVSQSPAGTFRAQTFRGDTGVSVDGRTRVQISLPARPESVTVIRQVLSGIAETDGWTPGFLTDAKIAVSEASTNVVVHAYRDGTEGMLTVEMAVNGERLEVQVRDQGAGISPRLNDRSAGLGLGLPLIAALTTEVQVKSDTAGDTVVSMVFAVPRGDEDA